MWQNNTDYEDILIFYLLTQKDGRMEGASRNDHSFQSLRLGMRLTRVGRNSWQFLNLKKLDNIQILSTEIFDVL